MTRRVAICGYGARVEYLPGGGGGWEIWRLAWDVRYADRWFEIHARRPWCNENPIASDIGEYEDFLRGLPGTLVLEATESLGTSHVMSYPMEAARALPFVGDYFCSSIGYMLAMAFLEKVDTVAINAQGYTQGDWQEAIYERPNVAYLAGLFSAQGMKIVWVGDDWHEIKLLDHLTVRDLTSERAKRWHLEWLYGNGLGRGVIRPETTARRADLLTVPWRDPPRYGYKLLEETSFCAANVTREWAREIGVVL